MKKSNSKSFSNSISFAKIREKPSRMSLTMVLFLFAFGILFSVVSLTAIGLLILTKANIIADVDGELQLGPVLLFMSLISLLLGGAVAFFGSRIPLKPINDIINKMNRLAAGDFKTRLELKSAASHPAIKEFADSFNTMAGELENTEMLRNDFINNFSHEFKTPIVSIMGLANLLEVGNISEEQRVQYARAIREESMRLSSMASNVLNLTKIESQSILTGISKFNLSEQIRSAVLLLEEKWTSKNIDLQLNFDEHMIEANEEFLKQVWINLVDNAVKFSPEGGMVSIEIIDKGKHFVINVSNTGSEIPIEKQKRIFNKFYQADESHATQGNGIGLAIVKKIIELHRGRVGVISENEMTTFFVTIPKKAVIN